VDRRAAVQSSLALGPWQVLIILGSLAGLLALQRPDELRAAAIVLSFGLFLAALHPRNGLFFTLLACPFFLGEPQDPFIFLLEGLAGLTLLSWLVRLVLERRLPRPPQRGLLWLLAGLFLVSLPLNLKELLASLSYLDGRQVAFLLLEGHKFHDLYALRSLALNLGGLLFLACCLDQLKPDDLKPLGLSLLCLGLALALLGLILALLRWQGLDWPARPSYLGLNLSGLVSRHHQTVLATTAFNRQYFNELLIPCLAAAGGLAALGPAQWRWPALAAGGVMLVSMILTGQRSPLACLGAMILTAGWLVGWAGGRRALRLAALACAGLVLVLAGLVALDLLVGADLLAGRILGLGSADEVAGVGLRPQVWRLAWAMIQEYPLTGLGAGTFRLLAPGFTAAAGLDYSGALVGVIGTAHNTFIQWAAELGLITLACLLVLGARLTGGGIRAFGYQRHRAEAGVMLVAGAGWLCFGFLQHVFYLTGLALLILAGLAGLARLSPEEEWPRLRRRLTRLVLALALLAVVLGIRIGAVAERPFREDYRAGFSTGEWPTGRDEAWWTTGRKAVFSHRPSHPYLIIPLAMPHALVFERPQKVTVWVDETNRTSILLQDTGWHELKLDLSRFRGQNVRIKLRTSYDVCPYLFDRNPDRRLLGVFMMDPRPADE